MKASCRQASPSVAVAATLLPEQLPDRKLVGPVGGGVDQIGDVGAGHFDAVKIPAGFAQAGGDGRIGGRLVPQRAGKNGCRVLVAGQAQAAPRMEHLRRLAGRVVAHHLKLEAGGGIVVADDLDHFALLVKAEEQPILERREARPVGAIRGGNHARKAKEIRRPGIPLQRTAQRNQGDLQRRQAAGIGPHLRFNGFTQAGEGKRYGRVAEQFIETRVTCRREVGVKRMRGLIQSAEHEQEDEQQGAHMQPAQDAGP